MAESQAGHIDGELTRDILVDALLLAFIPAVLVVIHLGLSASQRASLAFQYGDPESYTAFTAAVVHDSTQHLLANVAPYLIVVPPLYALYRLWGRRRQFWLIVGLILLVTPVVTTLVDYQVLYRDLGLVAEGADGRGFSGVVAALGGMAFASIGSDVRARLGLLEGIHTVMLLVLVSLAIVAAAVGALTPVVAGLLAIGAGISLASVIPVGYFLSPHSLALAFRRTQPVTSVLLLAAASVFVVVYGSIPSDIVVDGTMVNVLAHLSGFAVGIVLTWGVHTGETIRRQGGSAVAAEP